MDDWQHGGFAVYIHWPFCQAKCPYCDFNSHVAAQIDQDVWAKAYRHEILRMAEITQGREVASIFFGGGTPSLMEPRLVRQLIDLVAGQWAMAPDVEITLEANPTSVEAARFQGYRDAGVNRVSMGIQALNDDDLRRLGRLHSTDEAMRAFDIARARFDRVSFDLIYARQDQSLQDWEAELTRALSMAVDHLSLYQLTIEDGTAFADRLRRGGLRGLPDEDLSADLYELTQDLCEDHGFPAYEVSNHAKTDAGSRHNMVYWRMGDYVGIGPGAHGRLTVNGQRFATEQIKAPGAWLQAVDGPAERRADFTTIDKGEQATELALMSLRLSEGMNLGRYRALSGRDLPDAAIQQLIGLGLVSISDTHLTVTRRGRPLLNAILRDLLARDV